MVGGAIIGGVCGAVVVLTSVDVAGNVCDCVRERATLFTAVGGKPRLYSTISSSNRLRLIDLEEL